ncbi:hypothetical protein L7F22_049472, partial [Adiantum nelumboides]|nr:hypothetical protein [Adiantum nelumboides]
MSWVKKSRAALWSVCNSRWRCGAWQSCLWHRRDAHDHELAMALLAIVAAGQGGPRE